ncbi:lipopolysaccharide biosynthesis protein [Enterococcus gilvus]|uniref:lipopolysaccharide biosynthesis protein n=1 Tax=Enterococcus gilvus TaxID=160453 RepID=UPI001C8B868C|nr:polysaccharide biosynthesis C-terminal domain-containing protein [Enterococcus gilvus]MBX8937871.1 oligosaccharide flippase family protein [Enterococcus gilvus]
MSNSSSMVKKTLIYFAGNFSSKIFTVIIIPIYAQYLSASQLGEYDFQQTVGNLLMPVIVIAIWEAVLRFGLNETGEELARVVSTSVAIASITLTISFIILMMTYSRIYGLSALTFYYVLLIISMPIVTLTGYIARALKKNIHFAFSGVVSSFVNLLGIIILVIIYDQGLKGLLISSVLANLFNSVFLFISTKMYRYIHIRYFSKSLSKKLIHFSAPLILNLTFGWFTSSYSRFYINLTIGATANGIYAFASKFSGVMMQITGIINMSAIEDAVESIGDKEWLSRFEKNIENISALFIQMSCVLMSLTAVYYNFVNNLDFKSSIILVPLLIVTTFFSSVSTLLGNIFSVFNKTEKIFITTLFSGVANILFSLILGNFFGLIGVVLAQMASAFILAFSRYYYGQKIQNYHINFIKYIKYFVFFTITAICSIKGNLVIQLLIFGINCLIVVKENRQWIEKYLLALYKKIRK